MSRPPMFHPPESIDMQDMLDAILARFNVTPEEFEQAFRHNLARTRGKKSLVAAHVALSMAESHGVECAFTLDDEARVGNVAHSPVTLDDLMDESKDVALVHISVEGYAACKTPELHDVITRSTRNVTCRDCEDRFLRASPVHWWKSALEAVCGFTSGNGTTDPDRVTCPSCVSQDNKAAQDVHLGLVADRKESPF